MGELGDVNSDNAQNDGEESKTKGKSRGNLFGFIFGVALTLFALLDFLDPTRSLKFAESNINATFFALIMGILCMAVAIKEGLFKSNRN